MNYYAENYQAVQDYIKTVNREYSDDIEIQRLCIQMFASDPRKSESQDMTMYSDSIQLPLSVCLNPNVEANKFA